MRTILFINRGLPDKPAMASATLNTLGLGKITAKVAAKQNQPGHQEALKVMQKSGLLWPGSIISCDDFSPFEYELVIAFCERGEQVYPALPGNPVLVHWHVDDGSNMEEWKAVLDRINSLVTDLLHQGYLDALIQSRRNGELILDHLSEGIIAHGFNRKFFFFNRAAEKITGLSRKDILGRDCHDIFPEKFCSSHCAFCDGTQPPIFPTTPYQITVRNVDGEDRLVEMLVVPLRNSSGTPTGVVASMRDISREHELAKRLGEINQFAGIISQDARMQDVFQTITELADSDVPVLIQGESGTGKELVAAAIHNEGNRSSHRFVTINCGALPDDLLESELFGHTRGAFTGAIRDKKGRFEIADGGTIFLDEIGDITQAMQVKLLRVLQDGSFQKLGAEDDKRRVNVRIIAATHVNLREAIEAGHFREDLYYRLCVVPIHLPPLRKRLGDVPLLANHFLKQCAATSKRKEKTLSQETLNRLMDYDWPGNVRELQNVIRYLLVKCPKETIDHNYLPPELNARSFTKTSAKITKTRRKKLDIDLVLNALQKTDGNKAKAARLLGVGRATLYRFLSSNKL